VSDPHGKLHVRRQSGSHPSPVPRLPSLFAVLFCMSFMTLPATGQYLTRPQIPWRTITTERFDIHYPVEMEEWTRRVATRIERYADAVDGVIGNTPESRVTVIVEDPSNVANGFALPFMEGPVIFLWPTPPSPSPTFGAHRGWGEALAVHEYGHIAHLTFPSRNPRERLLWKFLPTQISPVAVKAPAWVIEGYATLIEGQLTGSGRPFSAGRASVLRQWALEGRLPNYAQLNGSGAFLGGNMRYLAGSAFLEWLAQRRGDSSLVHLWRRMSARQQRTFDEAFAGVFGVSAPEMYASFTVDVTERALQIRNRLRDAGLVEGELIQRLVGATGEPALSPDGTRIAVVVRRLNGPSRLIVMETNPPATDSALRRSRERLLERDPLDVVPFDSFPRPRRAVATLRPANGRSHESPRWLNDGITLLVSRDEPASDGITRPDLFLWNTRSKAVRRVTRIGGIRQADPSPDGREAAAVRCHAGTCSLGLVTLSSGAWRELVAGHPDLVWHRPRFSPDGRQIAASYQENGVWGIALIDPSSGGVRRLTSDYSRHSPAFAPDGRSLTVVSEQGGIANLEVIPLDSGPPNTITRVTGATLAPDVNRRDGSIWFLTLRSGGYDLRRLPAPGSSSIPVLAIHGGLAPAAPPSTPTAILHANDTPATVTSRGYGLGPRRWRVLPAGVFGAEGGTAMLMVGNIDPIARLSVVGLAGTGSRGTWRGASITAGLRRWTVGIETSLWKVDHEPSRSDDHLAPATSDIRSTAFGALARIAGERSTYAYVARGGFTTGEVANTEQTTARHAALGEFRARVTFGLGPASANILGGITGTAGTSSDESWRRVVGNGAVTLGTTRRWIRGDWVRGEVTRAAPGESGRASEQFVVGGSANPFINPLYFTQRVALPAVPAGFIHGPRFQQFRASLGGLSWEPYFLWIAGGDSIGAHARIAGLERTFEISALGFARLPAVRVRGGAAWSFDEPFRHRPRGYLGITYSP
jgi:hypothetical protein